MEQNQSLLLHSARELEVIQFNLFNNLILQLCESAFMGNQWQSVEVTEGREGTWIFTHQAIYLVDLLSFISIEMFHYLLQILYMSVYYAQRCKDTDSDRSSET